MTTMTIWQKWQELTEMTKHDNEKHTLQGTRIGLWHGSELWLKQVKMSQTCLVTLFKHSGTFLGPKYLRDCARGELVHCDCPHRLCGRLFVRQQTKCWFWSEDEMRPFLASSLSGRIISKPDSHNTGGILIHILRVRKGWGTRRWCTCHTCKSYQNCCRRRKV